jgi:hypothetical protein
MEFPPATVIGMQQQKLPERRTFSAKRCPLPLLSGRKLLRITIAHPGTMLLRPGERRGDYP